MKRMGTRGTRVPRRTALALAAAMAVPAWGAVFPAQLAGVLCSFAGMVAGSLLPQWVVDTHTPHRPLATEPA